MSESVRDLLILTFMSIRGRQQGEPNAANKFGEILVALEIRAVSESGNDMTSTTKIKRKRRGKKSDMNLRKEEEEVDIPIPL